MQCLEILIPRFRKSTDLDVLYCKISNRDRTKCVLGKARARNICIVYGKLAKPGVFSRAWVINSIVATVDPVFFHIDIRHCDRIGISKIA